MAASPSESRISANLPLLDDDNFEFWRQSVTLIACGLGIHAYLDKEPDMKKIDDNVRRSFFFLTNNMLTSMSSKAQQIASGGGNIDNLTPCAILKWLDAHYLPKSTANDIQLRRQLYTMKFRDGQSIEIFANEIRTLVNRINAAKNARSKSLGSAPSLIGERDMIAVLLMDLPLEYSTEVTLIERDPQETFESAVEMLRVRENRLKVSSLESRSANAVQNSKMDRKFPPCDVCGKFGHSSKRCYQRHQKQGAEDGGKRSKYREKCNRNGRASEVLVIPMFYFPERGINNAEIDEITNLWGQTTSGEATAVKIVDGSKLVVDSGCSRHVCGASMKKFVKQWRNGPKIRVSVADGTIHESNLYCTLEVKIMTSKGPQTIQIDDVLYIEDLCSMLLSISRICQKGYDVKFRENTCEIHGPQGVDINIIRPEGDTLFRIPILEGHSRNQGSGPLPNMEGTTKVMGAKTTSEYVRIWHNALGHPGRSVMCNLSGKGKIPKFRMKDIDDVISRCAACNLAKARALPVPEESKNRATKVMERIHCDAVTGLPPTAGGKTGFLLIVDEFSKFIDVRLISRKNETQDHIKEFVDRMESLGHRITKMRTDSAAEFVEDKAFTKWLIDRKIRQEASAPYAKHQNGVVERHIQTIEDRATAILIQSGLSKRFWGDAILSAVVTWNATTSKAKSPLEIVTGRTGDLGMLKPFGCRVYIRTDGPQQKHMEARAEAGILLGYSNIAKGYKVSRDPDWKMIVVRAPRDCMFKEDEFPAIDRKYRKESDEEPPIAPMEEKEAESDPMPIIVDSDIKIQRPRTPPLVIEDRYYSSIFQKDVTQNP